MAIFPPWKSNTSNSTHEQEGGRPWSKSRLTLPTHSPGKANRKQGRVALALVLVYPTSPTPKKPKTNRPVSCSQAKISKLVETLEKAWPWSWSWSTLPHPPTPLKNNHARLLLSGENFPAGGHLCNKKNSSRTPYQNKKTDTRGDQSECTHRFPPPTPNAKPAHMSNPRTHRTRHTHTLPHDRRFGL